jgi:hypothetical protein
MSIVGTAPPVVDLKITLPVKRKDGSAVGASDIDSVVILRNSIVWKTLPGPFTSATLLETDSTPAGESDSYSFYVVDVSGVRSAVSPLASVTVGVVKSKSPPEAGTLTAVSHAMGEDPVSPAAAPLAVPTAPNK